MPKVYVKKTTRVYRSHKVKPAPSKTSYGFMCNLDKRSAVAKTMLRRRDEIIASLGGSIGPIQIGLVERYVSLEMMVAGLEAKLAEEGTGRRDIAAQLTQACYAMTNAARALGIDGYGGDRRARQEETPAVADTPLADLDLKTPAAVVAALEQLTNEYRSGRLSEESYRVQVAAITPMLRAQEVADTSAKLEQIEETLGKQKGRR
jgi:hypothetical protein